MSRLPRPTPAELDEEQRALYDAIAGGPRARGPQVFALTDAAGRLEGPFGAMLTSPPVGGALQGLGAALRYGSSLGARSREIAVLLVAYAEDSAFEVYAHEAVALAAGLTAQELVMLRDRHFDDLPERVLAATVTALVDGRDLDATAYELARTALGERALFELTTLVGYYELLALQLRVFRVGLPTA